MQAFKPALLYITYFEDKTNCITYRFGGMRRRIRTGYRRKGNREE